mmetsp:Transcript_14678/g.38146  ORF Transcript_14678/g.38146 Transcript_14678/m.38146 type:complete len:483 (-) Transcript_14678:219-1667(-)
MPGVQFFCLFAASSFAVSAAAMFTFFLSLLVLDERRLRDGRVSFAPCIRVGAKPPAAADEAVPNVEATETVAAPKASASKDIGGSPAADAGATAVDLDATPTGPIGRMVAKYYAPALLRPAVSVGVVLVFLLVGGLSIASVPTLKLGMPDADILPDDSYVQHTLRVEQETFGGQRLQASVVVRNESFREHDVRQAIDLALDEMQGREYVTFAFDRWHVVYKKYLQQKASGVPKGDKFTSELQDFLDDYTQWQDDVVCESDDSCDAPVAGRYSLFYTKPQSGSAIDSINRRDQLERALERRGLMDSFVFHFTFLINGARIHCELRDIGAHRAQRMRARWSRAQCPLVHGAAWWPGHNRSARARARARSARQPSPRSSCAPATASSRCPRRRSSARAPTRSGSTSRSRTTTRPTAPTRCTPASTSSSASRARSTPPTGTAPGSRRHRRPTARRAMATSGCCERLVEEIAPRWPIDLISMTGATP